MKEYVRNETSRMFEHPFLEACSKVHPAVPFIFYLPIISVLLGRALYTGVTPVSFAVLFVPLGWITWDVLEYAIHRGFFHWEGSGPISRKIHEITHGYHHKFPDDAQRLVMPLGASIPSAALIWLLLSLFGRPDITAPFFFGIVGGYLFYDFTHWSTHYRTPKTQWGKAMRSHHMAHHFANPEHNFGISHRWIDAVVGTLKRRESDAATEQ